MKEQIITFIQLILVDILRLIGIVVTIIVGCAILGLIFYCLLEYTQYSIPIIVAVIVITLLFKWLISKWQYAATITAWKPSIHYTKRKV